MREEELFSPKQSIEDFMVKKAGGVVLASLKASLVGLAAKPPANWGQSGGAARPNLHGILRYPAMMVPCMQGDIIDVLVSSTSGERHIIDPFVGSGTTLTESMIRGINFTGVDINPLAALVCEAKLAIDRGADIETAAATLLARLTIDRSQEIDAEFENRSKWFDDAAARRFSTLRRAICAELDVRARKVLWVVFAETVRLCSNSRPSTYKLHKRADGDEVPAERIVIAFRENLHDTVQRVTSYRASLKQQRRAVPKAEILCGDVRTVNVRGLSTDHLIMVTSPPYGDNTTTIPYGQFSYLALQWIPREDLPQGVDPSLLENTHSIDSASLGGSTKNAESKREAACLVSPTFAKFVESAFVENKLADINKVATFVYDYFEAAAQVHSLHVSARTSAHWIVTTGNRTAAGMIVPFDLITRDIVEFLGGKELTSVNRKLPTKRMPSRNNLGSLINKETTLIAEFGQ